VTFTLDEPRPAGPGWRRLRRDPVLLIAWLVLGATGLVAAGLTAVDRTRPPRPAAAPVPPIAASAATDLSVPGSATSPSPSTDTAQPRRVPPVDHPACPASGLLLRVGEVSGAMGLRALGIELVNCGTRPYAVQGYPDVRILDVDGRPLDLQVFHGGSAIAAVESVDAPPLPVTVKPGASAWATVLWRTTARDGVDLQVAPLPGRPWLTVRPGGGIDLGDTGRLGVGPWTAPGRT
jgi:hypothetical protein